MCVGFKNIGNNYQLKIKKTTLSYASTTNQINTYWFKKKKKKMERFIIAIESLLYLIPFQAKVNFCCPWNANWIKKYMPT